MNEPITTQTDATRYVFIPRARCPVCQSADLKPLRSKDQGDGSIRRTRLCRVCGHRFFVIVE